MSAREALLQHQLDDMMQSMEQLKKELAQSKASNRQGHSPPTGSFGVNRSSLDQSQSSTMGDGTMERTMNKTQLAIMESIRVVPVTKEEMEYRRNCPELPEFTGDPTKYFRFMATYRESAAQGRFSLTANMKRVMDALREPARS